MLERRVPSPAVRSLLFADRPATLRREPRLVCPARGVVPPSPSPGEGGGRRRKRRRRRGGGTQNLQRFFFFLLHLIKKIFFFCKPEGSFPERE